MKQFVLHDAPALSLKRKILLSLKTDQTNSINHLSSPNNECLPLFAPQNNRTVAPQIRTGLARFVVQTAFSIVEQIRPDNFIGTNDEMMDAF